MVAVKKKREDNKEGEKEREWRPKEETVLERKGFSKEEKEKTVNNKKEWIIWKQNEKVSIKKRRRKRKELKRKRKVKVQKRKINKQ